MEDAATANASTQEELKLLKFEGKSSSDEIQSSTHGICEFQYLVCALASISGFLFGYDLCVMVVALSLIGQNLSLTTAYQESIVSSLMIGAVGGSLAAGTLSERLGRKPSIIITSMLFFLGGIMMAFSPSLAYLLLGRFVVGFAVGGSGPCVSVYISEIAQTRQRGMLITLNELLLCVGCLSSILIDSTLVSAQHGWRYMLGLTAIPALLQLITMPFMPESPQWLARHHQPEAARRVVKLMGLEPIDPDNTGEEAHAVSVSILFDVLRRNTTYRHRFFISIGVAIGQAITGASAVLYYSKNILYAADVQSSGAAEAGIAIAKLIGALFTIVYVDRIGRRKLLLSGTAIMIMCHIIFALLFWSTPLDAYDTQVKHQDKVLSPVQRILVVFFLHLFILAWNISWAPLMWIICSEVLPNELRSTGMGITFALLWLCSALVNQTLLSLFATFGISGTFIFYSFMSSVALLFVGKYIPETCGKSFADISTMFQET